MVDLNTHLNYMWLELAEAGPGPNAQAAYGRLNQRAQGFFRQARHQGRLRRIWAALTGRAANLLDLRSVAPGAVGHGGYYAGLRTVPLRQIKGSENRCHDFDVDWHPLQNHTQGRWQSVAMVVLEGKPLPPVELIQVGDVYFVRDGHHRISVARTLGREEIDAEVIVWDTATPAPKTEIPVPGRWQQAPA